MEACPGRAQISTVKPCQGLDEVAKNKMLIGKKGESEISVHSLSSSSSLIPYQFVKSC